MAVVLDLIAVELHVHDEGEFLVFDEDDGVVCEFEVGGGGQLAEGLVGQQDHFSEEEEVGGVVIGHQFPHDLLHRPLRVLAVLYYVLLCGGYLQIQSLRLHLLLDLLALHLHRHLSPVDL